MRLVKNKILLPFLMLFALVLFTSCGSSEESVSYNDGTYDGVSETHTTETDGSAAGYAKVTIVIEASLIKSCDFKLYNLDGTEKDETYGSDFAQESYIKAQKAIQAATKYAEALVEAQNIKKVSVISGATVTYNEFVEAVNDALSKAKA